MRSAAVPTRRDSGAGRTPRGAPVYNVARPVLNRDMGIEFAVFDV